MDLHTLRRGVCVVTGSGTPTGIGWAVAAQARAEHGMHVMLSDIRESQLIEAVRALRELDAADSELRVEGCVCDVTLPSSVEALLHAVKTAFPSSPIQVVGANAGILLTGSTLLSGSAREWERTFAVNVLGVANTLRVFTPVLVAQRKPAIMMVTASSAGVITAGTGPYGASKQAAVGVAETLHSELSAMPENPLEWIRVVTICPALVRTPLLTSAQGTAKDVELEPEAVREGDAASQRTVLAFRAMWERGMPASFVGAEAFKYASQGKFYCILDNELERDGMSMGLDDRLADRFAGMKTRDLASARKDRTAMGEAKKTMTRSKI